MAVDFHYARARHYDGTFYYRFASHYVFLRSSLCYDEDDRSNNRNHEDPLLLIYGQIDENNRLWNLFYEEE
jgi:hypothetical protein